MCGLSSKQANNLYDECEAAKKQVAKEVRQALTGLKKPEQHEVLQHLLLLLERVDG